MSARGKRQTNHDSVRATVPEDGHGADGPRALETSPPDPESDQRTGADRAPAARPDPIDELARRRLHDLFAAHRPAMEARAKQLCRPPLEPDDLVQDALERAITTRSPVVDPTRVRAWLLRIMTNKFIDGRRVDRRLPQYVELDDNLAAPTASEPSMWEHVSPEDLRAAIEKLPDDTRETYRRFTVEGQSHAEIAAAQNIPIATVASRVFRARKQLKTLLMAMHLAKRGKDTKGFK
jgi:RNA polymerase sigma-70 factor (ECF subfamily)